VASGGIWILRKLTFFNKASFETPYPNLYYGIDQLEGRASSCQQNFHPANVRNFTVSTEIFYKPSLDIYSQMIYIVLSSSTADSTSLTIDEVAKKGRMTTKYAIKAMQALVDEQLIPHKLFRKMIGEFQDDRLSWAAKGLLTYCKEHKDISIARASGAL
jgi:hypothetical protein